MKRYLLSTLAVIALAVSAHAQSMNVIPSFIVHGESIVITVHDPAKANTTVWVYVIEPGNTPFFTAVPVALNDSGDGIAIWVADVDEWDALSVRFQYTDSDGNIRYQYRWIQ
jgi:hypothetical protein